MTEIQTRLARMINAKIDALTSLDSPHYRGTLAEIAHSRSTVFALIDAYTELFGFDATLMGSGWFNRTVAATRALEGRVRDHRDRLRAAHHNRLVANAEAVRRACSEVVVIKPAAATVFASTTGESR